jgi:uncharacterized protein (DUF1501 family)
MRLHRRDFLQSALLGAASLSLPRVLLADLDTDSRFVFVILRGAMDGLAAVVPYADPNYLKMRGELALSTPQESGTALKLDGLFALHPSLVYLHERFAAGELVALHAVASPYRERSHFDGQDVLENGAMRAHASQSGWLNRCVASLPSVRTRATEQTAIAFAQNIPLVLRGDARVSSWAPSKLTELDADTLQRVAEMYSSEPYFAERLQAALQVDAMAKDNAEPAAMLLGASEQKRDPLGALGALTTAAGRMLGAADGPRIAVIETTGWDTHFNQGAEKGVLAYRLGALDSAIESFRTALGSAWSKTAVLVATEFGRTVAINGTRGTDHGTASCAFLVGGAVAGGRVVCDWPGLAQSQLYEDRDLKPTANLYSICKGVLQEQFGVPTEKLDGVVFPGSAGAKATEGLIRRA